MNRIDIVVPHERRSAQDVAEGDAELGTLGAVTVGPEGLVLVGEGVEGEEEALLGMGLSHTMGLPLPLSPALLVAGGDLGGSTTTALFGDAAEDAGEV